MSGFVGGCLTLEIAPLALTPVGEVVGEVCRA